MSEGVLERLVAAAERIATGVESMAQSLQVIAIRVGARPNQAPQWLGTEITFEEGTPATVLLSSLVRDPDPDYPGAMPLEIDVQQVLAALPAAGITVVDLGRDVEVRYDGRALGATPEAPYTIPGAFIGVADDGVPPKIEPNGTVAGGK